MRDAGWALVLLVLLSAVALTGGWAIATATAAWTATAACVTILFRLIMNF